MPLRTAFFLSFVTFVSGCATTVAKVSNGFGQTYEGLSCDQVLVRDSVTGSFRDHKFWLIPVIPFAITDSVLSAATDTLFLPIDLVQTTEPVGRFECKDRTTETR